MKLEVPTITGIFGQQNVNGLLLYVVQGRSLSTPIKR